MKANLATPRAAIMAVFAAFGAIIGTFAGSAPQIMQQSGLNNASYGFGVTLMTTASVAAMAAVGFLGARVPRKSLLLAAIPLMFILGALMLTGQSMAMFYAAAIGFGSASAILDVTMNAEAGTIEHDLKRPIYTTFHASVSLSLAFFAILSSYLSTNFGTSVSITAASVPVLVSMFLVVAAVPERTLPAQISARKLQELLHAFTRPLVLMGVASGLIIAAEVTALFWSSELLVQAEPGLAEIAGIGAAFFGLCNAVVRLFGDRLRGRFGNLPLMTATTLVAIVGFAGLGLFEGFAASVVSFAIAGFGLAILMPCLFSMSANETPENRAAGIGVAMLIAGVPRIMAPTAFGAVTEALSTRFAFGLCAVLLVGALICFQLLQAIRR
jgi:MFS family permease